MIREIITDIGNFGSFKDIYLFMRDEHKTSITIKSINMWDFSNLNFLTGTYTIDEIKEIIEKE